MFSLFSLSKKNSAFYWQKQKTYFAFRFIHNFILTSEILRIRCIYFQIDLFYINLKWVTEQIFENKTSYLNFFFSNIQQVWMTDWKVKSSFFFFFFLYKRKFVSPVVSLTTTDFMPKKVLNSLFSSNRTHVVLKRIHFIFIFFKF